MLAYNHHRTKYKSFNKLSNLIIWSICYFSAIVFCRFFLQESKTFKERKKSHFKKVSLRSTFLYKSTITVVVVVVEEVSPLGVRVLKRRTLWDRKKTHTCWPVMSLAQIYRKLLWERRHTILTSSVFELDVKVKVRQTHRNKYSLRFFDFNENPKHCNRFRELCIQQK